MKSLLITAVIFLMTLSSISQPTFEMRTDNFKQIDESTIQWELWIRKTSGNDFGLYTWMLQWSYSSGLYNGGLFQGTNFTISPGADAVFAGHYNNADAVVNQTNHFFSYTPSSLPNTGEFMTLVTEEYSHIATYTAQLTKDGNPHNFASADPSFAHRLNGIVEVFAADNPYQGPGTQSQITGTLTTAPGAKINTRQLAGYWFTGEGDWSETVRWNNVTSENSNVVPPLATNNVGIAGQATVTDTRSVNQLTIAEEALLVLSGAAGNIGWLTVNGDLFNDNQTPAPPKDDVVTIAGWDFEGTTSGSLTPYPYLADDGITENSGFAPISTSSAFDGFYVLQDLGLPASGTISAFGSGWRTGLGGNAVYHGWVVEFETSGYTGLKLSSKQWSDINNLIGGGIGPNSFKLQYSTDGTNWLDVSGGSVSVADNWTTGVLIDLELPSDLDNKAVVYLKWLNTVFGGTGISAIDDILITGEEIPPPPTGLLIASTADGTGSLIHNTADVEATIERYIPAAGYHLASVPFTQASNPRSGWFIWSYLYEYAVGTQTWESMGNDTWTPLNVDQGYMVYKYPGPDKWSSDTTYAMMGLMNSGSFVCAVSGDAQDHNLVPNPFPSAIDWDAAAGWTKSDIYNAIWIWNNGNYAAYVNGTPANGGSKYIPVGQAFFIQASGASAGLTMNNNVRVHNAQPFFKDSKEQLNILRIKAKANNYRDEMVVYFDDEASTAFDGQFDASKMYGLTEAPQIYSVSTNNHELIINGMPFSNEVISVPVGFKLDAAGEVTFEASSIESFDPEVTIFLWDMLTNTMTNLRENQQYNFVHNPDNDPVRFALLFNSAVGIAESATNPVRLYAADNNLYLHIPEEIDEDFLVQLFDTGGRMIFSTTASTGSAIINVPSIGAGIYIVQLVSDRHSVVKKVFMK